jgi:hypothetical protein
LPAGDHAESSASVGGGIANSGTLTMSDSVVTNNTATTSGGGIFVFGGAVTLDRHHRGGQRPKQLLPPQQRLRLFRLRAQWRIKGL